jgi:Cu/Zn superoxide dismutase
MRKEAAAAERARRTRNRLTLRVLIDDWNRLRLAGRRATYAAEAVRALHYAFADHLDDAAEVLDRADVVRALDALMRRRKRKDGDDKRKGTAMTGRTAAYGRAAYAWPAGDHGFHVHVNPNCGPGNGPNGQPAAGMAAGDHYDPANTGKHRGPLGEGHKGDLPVLTE